MKKIFYAFVFVMTLFSPVLAQVNLQNGLKAYLPFSGNVLDESGNGMDGQVHGNLQLTTNRVGTPNSAYYFDGNDYVTISAAGLTNQAYTYSIWAKPREVKSNVYTLFAIGDQTREQALLLSGIDSIWNGGQYNDDGTSALATQKGFVDTTQWYHFVLTGNSSKIQLFINGTLVNSNTDDVTGAPLYGDEPVVTIGARSGPMQYFKGRIDDIRIYNRVLSSQEVKALYDENINIAAVADKYLEENFKILPNPNAGSFRLSLPADLQNCELNIQNSLGEVVYTGTYSHLENDTEIALNERSQGIYLLTIRSDQGMASKKIIVQ